MLHRLRTSTGAVQGPEHGPWLQPRPGTVKPTSSVQSNLPKSDTLQMCLLVLNFEGARSQTHVPAWRTFTPAPNVHAD